MPWVGLQCMIVVFPDHAQLLFESWIHFFDPQRKVSNKLCATKSTKIPCIARQTMSAVFVTIYRPQIQVAVPKGKGVTALNYRDKV